MVEEEEEVAEAVLEVAVVRMGLAALLGMDAGAMARRLSLLVAGMYTHTSLCNPNADATTDTEEAIAAVDAATTRIELTLLTRQILITMPAPISRESLDSAILLVKHLHIAGTS